MIATISPRPAGRIARAFVVSAEMTLVVGGADTTATPLPDNAVTVLTDADDNAVRFVSGVALPEETEQVAMLVAESVFVRLGGSFPGDATDTPFRLPAELRPVLRAMLDCKAIGEPGDLYCAARAVELLCEIVRHREQGALLPLGRDGALSDDDTARILRARRLIDEHWRERLTLDHIASHCGVNREKLTRGFRSLFDCSIAEAIVERRLGEAQRMLLSTELPVAAVGYRSGYLNNASFSRAFARRFGTTPRDFRVQRIAA